MLRIDWRQRLENGALLTDPHYAALLQAGRELVYLLMTAPPGGRRRHRPGSALDWPSTSSRSSAGSSQTGIRG